MPISRHKSFKYKENKVLKPPRTGRTELATTERVYAVGVITGMRGDYDSQHQLAEAMGRSKGTISMLAQRVEKKAEELNVFLWDLRKVVSQHNRTIFLAALPVHVLRLSNRTVFMVEERNEEYMDPVR